MPFIRYDVGDTAIWQDISCDCGRETKVIKQIEGRVEDFIITPENRKISRFDYIFKDTEGIKEAQVIQKERGHIIIRIIPRENYSKKTEDLLLREIRARISLSIGVKFEYVDQIPREANGKFRAVVSELDD
jgi:phenylacetate-CoA ligase